VQCHYIGFHASTGLDTIDWFIGDHLTAGEDLADQFVESLWRLPRLWLACCRPPFLPYVHSNRKCMGPVLGSFNQFAKVRGETLRFWAAALRRIPEAELHLKNFITDSPRPRQRIVEELSSLGIDPQRVVFLPRTETRQEHLASYQGIDVALDTTPWAGATTTVEALLMGVPVVGILGNTTASRMGCSILRALGREQWITTTPETFAEAAAELLQNPEALRAGRDQLRQEVLASPLLDGADLTHHLQAAFTSMVAGAAAKPASSGLIRHF
jgi:predicted O-linked N-acetylglucosamine transferase (SPINDLY family)